jgi:hypothetical protein
LRVEVIYHSQDGTSPFSLRFLTHDVIRGLVRAVRLRNIAGLAGGLLSRQRPNGMFRVVFASSIRLN